MAVYRFFKIGEDDDLYQSPLLMDCQDDKTAILKAAELRGHEVIEVWNCSRLLARLSTDCSTTLVQEVSEEASLPPHKRKTSGGPKPRIVIAGLHPSTYRPRAGWVRERRTLRQFTTDG